MGIRVNTPTGEKVIATDDYVVREKLTSINKLTNMQMNAMDLLWKISMYAVNAPARGDGSKRMSIPKMLIDDARSLVNDYRKEAKRWDAEEGENKVDLQLPNKPISDGEDLP